MCPVGNTLALESDEEYTCTVSFLSLYTFSAALPSQKCVLSLDDVMLQVQRIYVHGGGGRSVRRVGGGVGGGGLRSFSVTSVIYSWNQRLLCKHLKNRPGRPRCSDTCGLAHRLKWPCPAKTPPIPLPL